MVKEIENSKNQHKEGTKNPSAYHLPCSDNSIEMIGKAQVVSDSSSGKVDEGSDTSGNSSKAVVFVNRNGETPASDNHIMCEILCRLRSKYLMRFKSVCTQWKSLIEKDSYMIDLHYRSQKLGNRILLFISSAPPPKDDEPERVRGIIEFTSVSPTGTGVQKLELGRPIYGIPKQTVAGLVCITSGPQTFLIYNPSTGERTPWIKTTTINENIGGKSASEVDCIAFGYSPRTKEHKVLCVSSIKREGVSRCVFIDCSSSPEEEKVNCYGRFEDGRGFIHADDVEEVRADEEQVCEVFTVGKNTWRKIDAVPPYSLAIKACYVGELGEYNEESKSVYVRGKIYWRFRYTRKGEVIMVFDVETEKFSVIPIPGYVTETPWKYPQTVELLEVDGHIAVLNFTPGCSVSFWILDQDDGSNKWSYEKVVTACGWKGNLNLSIQAISGTHLIILKREMSETTYIYDRVRKSFHAFTVNEMHGLNYLPGELRQILLVVDCLAPVCTKRRSTF